MLQRSIIGTQWEIQLISHHKFLVNFHEDTQFSLGVICQLYHLGTRYFMLLYYKNEKVKMVCGAPLDKVVVV